MNPKGHNRLLRTNEAWFQEKSFPYDMEFHGMHVMGYMNPMDAIHGHVSHGDLRGIHVSHGYSWDIILNIAILGSSWDPFFGHPRNHLEGIVG